MVVGFDARRNSDVFARDTAAVVVGAGGRAAILPSALPTPVLAYAIRFLGADAGVMVTASHNPPEDNGYKVYLGDGSQIVSPSDADIATQIARVAAVADVPLADDGWETLGDDVLDAYLDDAVTVVAADTPRERHRGPHRPARRGLRDGRQGVRPRRVCRADPRREPGRAGPGRSRPCTSPTPRSPGRWTPPSSSPSRPGRTWSSPTTPTPTGAPSRCPAPAAGGCCAATRWARCSARTSSPAAWPTARSSPTRSSRRGCSPRWPRPPGCRHEETLTGFKWISRVEGLRYGYEEALGYCVDPPHVRDKDGVSAALVVAEMTATLKAEGRSLTDLLDDLAEATACTPPTRFACGSPTSP